MGGVDCSPEGGLLEALPGTLQLDGLGPSTVATLERRSTEVLLRRERLGRLAASGVRPGRSDLQRDSVDWASLTGLSAAVGAVSAGFATRASTGLRADRDRVRAAVAA